MNRQSRLKREELISGMTITQVSFGPWRWRASLGMLSSVLSRGQRLETGPTDHPSRDHEPGRSESDPSSRPTLGGLVWSGTGTKDEHGVEHVDVPWEGGGEGGFEVRSCHPNLNAKVEPMQDCKICLVSVGTG